MGRGRGEGRGCTAQVIGYALLLQVPALLSLCVTTNWALSLLLGTALQRDALRQRLHILPTLFDVRNPFLVPQPLPSSAQNSYVSSEASYSRLSSSGRNRLRPQARASFSALCRLITRYSFICECIFAYSPSYV